MAKWGSWVGVWGTGPADVPPAASSQPDRDRDPDYPPLLSNLPTLPPVDPQSTSPQSTLLLGRRQIWGVQLPPIVPRMTERPWPLAWPATHHTDTQSHTHTHTIDTLTGWGIEKRVSVGSPIDHLLVKSITYPLTWRDGWLTFGIHNIIIYNGHVLHIHDLPLIAL